MTNPSSSKHKIKSAIPKLYDMIETTVYGDVWERKELSKRDRSLITVAAMIGMRQTEQMRSHMEKALQNGVTAQECARSSPISRSMPASPPPCPRAWLPRRCSNKNQKNKEIPT